MATRQRIIFEWKTVSALLTRSLLLLLLWRSSVSAADDLTKLSIEELMNVTIESVSKFEQRLTDAPAAVSIVTRDDIRKYGYRTLAEILASVRGLYIRYDRNYTYLGMRGFGRPGEYNARFLLLVDGHRLNDNIYNQSALGNDFNIDVDLIERVEVIRGSSSSLYGTNAFVGVINVKTKSGNDIAGSETAMEGGKFSTYRGRQSFGYQFDNGLNVLFSGSRFGSHGERRLFYPQFDDPTSNFGIAKNRDGESAGNVFAKLAYEGFSLAASFIDREKEIPTASFGTLFNQDSNTVDKRGFVDLKYERDFTDLFGLKANIYYDYYTYRGHYVYDYGAPDGVVTNRDHGQNQWYGGELQLTKTLFERHKVVVGGESRYSFQLAQKNVDVVTYLDDQRHPNNWAIYFQDEFELVKSLRLNAGLRYDRYDIFGGTLNPRAALIYQPLDKTIIKFIYGQAFRAPNAYELYWSSPGGTKANPDLKPETIRNFELGLQQFLGLGLWGTANIYYHRIKDLITQETDPSDGLLVYRNLGRIQGRGLELELEGKRQNGWRGRLSYTLQQTRDLDTEKILANSPTHLVKLNGVMPLWNDKLFMGFEEQFTSKRQTLSGNNPARAYFRTNLTLFSEKIVKGFETSASIYNLFNRKFSDPAAGEHEQDKIQQDGRGFRFKLTYRF